MIEWVRLLAWVAWWGPVFVLAVERGLCAEDEVEALPELSGRWTCHGELLDVERWPLPGFPKAPAS